MTDYHMELSKTIRELFKRQVHNRAWPRGCLPCPREHTNSTRTWMKWIGAGLAECLARLSAPLKTNDIGLEMYGEMQKERNSLVNAGISEDIITWTLVIDSY